MTISKWAWRAPITQTTGYHTEQFYRWLDQFQNQVGGGITLTPGPGIGISGSPVAPGGTVIITNTGVTSLTQTQPTSGLTITNSAIPQTGAISSTFALASDLAAVEAISTYGLATRTADDTWTTRTIQGTSGRITVSNGNGVLTDPSVDISSSYIGQNTITTLGTITTGTWNGTTLDIAHGGTGLTTTPTNGQIDIGNGSGFTRTTLTAGSGVSITNGAGSITIDATGSGGTVTSVSVVTANGVSGSVANPTTTPAITLSLGAITPTSVTASGTVAGTQLLAASSSVLGAGIETGLSKRIGLSADNVNSFMFSSGPLNINAITADPMIFYTNNTERMRIDSTGVITLGTISSGTWNGAAIQAAYGGTGLTSYTIGDLLYASGPTTLASLSDVATGNVLLSGGVGTAPLWGKVSNSALTNSQVTIGSTSISLGSTSTSLAGLTTLSMSNQLTNTLVTGTAPFVISSTTRVANLNVASAGNADTVTTNANLTGPITSTGNATTVASQTGTGSTFVMNTSPTLVTPNIGVASGTSVSLSSTATATAFIPTSSTIPTNGIYLPASNAVGFSTNSTYVAEFNATGHLLIGTSTDTAKVVVSDNSTAFSGSVPTGTSIHSIGANATGTILHSIDAINGGAAFFGRRTNTSLASPAAPGSDAPLVSLQGAAYDGTSFSTTAFGSIFIRTAEIPSSTAHGAYITLNTCAIGATTTTERMRVDSAGNIYGTSGTTGMTDGFFYIPSAAGAPSGTPTAVSGCVPMYYDSTNNNFYVYNGAWKKVTLT